MAVEVVSAVGSHCVIFISVCDWRTSKGLARREKREERRYREEGREEGRESRGENGEGKELDGPFLQSVDTPFVSLAHSNLHTQYAAAVW